MTSHSHHPFQLRTAAFLAEVESKKKKVIGSSHLQTKPSLKLPPTFQFSQRLYALSKKKETSTKPMPKHENWKKLGISREEYYAMGQDEHYDNYDFDHYDETETDRLIFDHFNEHSRKCFAAAGFNLPDEEDNPFNFD